MFRENDLDRLARKGGLATGQIGEHLVCADILACGYPVHLAAQGSPFDLIAQVGSRLVRVQVKTTVEQRDYARGCMYYGWSTRKSTGTKQDYADKDCDCIAFVALDGPFIAYLPVEYCGRTVQMAHPATPLTMDQRGLTAKTITAFPFSRYVAEDLNATS